MGELRRVFSKKVLILLLILLVGNALLFAYEQMAGRSISEMNDASEYYNMFIDRYSDNDMTAALEQVTDDYTNIRRFVRTLKSESGSNDNNPSQSFYPSDEEQTRKQLTTDELLGELDKETLELISYYNALTEQQKSQFEIAIKSVKNKLTYLAGYEAGVDNVLANADNMKKFSLFAKKDSFSYNNIIRTASDFERVSNVSVKLDNDKAVDAFVHYYYMYYIAAAFMVIIIYSLFSERENGMWQIIHNTPFGRVVLAAKRVILIVASSFGVLLILYFITALESFLIYGGWSFAGNPIQTINDFGNFTYSFSKAGYMTSLFLLSWFIICCLGIIVWMIFTIFRNRNHTLISMAAIVGVEILLYQKISIQSVYSALHHINIVSFLKINELYKGYLNWGFGRYVFSVMSIIILAMFLIAIAAVFVGIARYQVMRPFGKTSVISGLLGKLNIQYQKIFAKYPVILKELHKLIITGKGVWVVIFVIVISLYFSLSGTMTFTDAGKERDSIYIAQGGEDYSEISAMIAEAQDNYAKSVEEAKAAAERYQAGEIEITTYYNYISTMQYQQQALNRVSEFTLKQEYIKRVQEEKGQNAWMISDRGYEEIFGQYSSQRELILIIALIIGVMIIISESIALEYRTGMESIVRSSQRGRQWIMVRKITACVIFTVVLTLIVYGIDLFCMYKIYGMPYLNAPLISLTFMEETAGTMNITILGWLALRTAVRLLIALITMTSAIIISRIIGKKGSRSLMLAALAVIIAVVVLLRKSCGLL